MSCERIAAFAGEMVEDLSRMTARAIVKTRVPQDPGSLSTAICDLFNNWKLRNNDTVMELGRELFPQSTPWDVESAFEAGRLLFRAFETAIETAPIWDRRLSPETIASRIRTAMYTHINKWSDDR